MVPATLSLLPWAWMIGRVASASRFVVSSVAGTTPAPPVEAVSAPQRDDAAPALGAGPVQARVVAAVAPRVDRANLREPARERVPPRVENRTRPAAQPTRPTDVQAEDVAVKRTPDRASASTPQMRLARGALARGDALRAVRFASADARPPRASPDALAFITTVLEQADAGVGRARQAAEEVGGAAASAEFQAAARLEAMARSEWEEGRFESALRWLTAAREKFVRLRASPAAASTATR
jgi:hypothetical protein